MATYKTGSVPKTYDNLEGDDGYNFRLGSFSPMPKIPAGATLTSLKYSCTARRNSGVTSNSGKVEVDAGGTLITVVSGMGRNTDYNPSPVELSSYARVYGDGTILFTNGSNELHVEVQHNTGLLGKSWWKITNNVITAYYSLPVYTITVNASPDAGGTVTGGGDYDVGSTATLTATPNTGYKFVKWSDDANAPATRTVTVTGNATYTATFEPIAYTVTFKDDNGAALKTETVNYNSTATPPAGPVKADTAQWDYTFDGWYDANGNKWTSGTTITGDIVYTARYNATAQVYTVKWFNYDGTLLETDEGLHYGDIPIYNGETPTKPGNAEHSYQFAGWNYDTENGITPILGTTYIYITAEFREIDNTYKVAWVNDGVVIETDEAVPYGDKPDYNGATPTKPSDAQYDYDFIGWSTSVTDPPKAESELDVVKGDITYTAVYSATLRMYPLTVILFDSEATTVYEYGTEVTIEAPAITGYKFTQWNDGNTDNPRTITVTGEATYQAVYERVSIPIIVNNEQVTGVYIVPTTQTIVYIITGEVPAVETNGVRVDGWKFEVSNNIPDNSYPLKWLLIGNTRVY